MSAKKKDVPNCIFCKIVFGEMKGEIVYKDADVIGFVDISPQAPKHILIIPRDHLVSIEDIAKKKPSVLESLMTAVPKIARKLKLSGGYRVVMNSGKDAGQLVPHLHLHLLGGRKFHWPPG